MTLDLLFTSCTLVIAIAETKLDDSFPTEQFLVEGYYPPLRKDRNAHGGGLLLYIRNDIPCRPITNLTNLHSHPESIFVELFIRKTPWLIGAIYKPSSLNDTIFTKNMENMLDAGAALYENILLLGDMNFDLQQQNKSKPLINIMDQYALTNLIDEPTFVSRHGLSSLDVALTNVKASFLKGKTLDTGLSDGHSMIIAITRLHTPRLSSRQITYRSFKHFNEADYRADVAQFPSVLLRSSMIQVTSCGHKNTSSSQFLMIMRLSKIKKFDLNNLPS